MSVVVRRATVSARHAQDTAFVRFANSHLLSPHAIGSGRQEFVPTLAGSTTPGTQTYAVQLGRANRVEREVTASFCVGLSAKDGATAGNLRISGLPYPAGASLAYATTLCYVRSFDIDAAGGFTNVEAILGPGDSFIQLYESGDNVVPVPLTAADFVATSYIYGTIVYNI